MFRRLGGAKGATSSDTASDRLVPKNPQEIIAKDAKSTEKKGSSSKGTTAEPTPGAKAPMPHDSKFLAAALKAGRAQCPFAKHHGGKGWPEQKLRERVPLATRGFTHVVSDGSAALLKDIGGGDRIRSLCHRFYAKGFQDRVFRTFLFEDDGPEEHGKRLGDWIIEKMGGEGLPWTESGRFGTRQEAHYKAWNAARRPRSVVGRRFKLDDCRIWMRLMFWAARDEGLDKHRPFWTWYVDFISHFIRVYERSAPPYARSAAAWSAKPENIEAYLKGGRLMRDVLGKGVPKSVTYSESMFQEDKQVF